MAFEYLEYDLWALANSSEVNLTATHIKTYMKQMLDAIAYMHTNKVRSLTSCLRCLISEVIICILNEFRFHFFFLALSQISCFGF